MTSVENFDVYFKHAILSTLRVLSDEIVENKHTVVPKLPIYSAVL